ncbi:ribonuclease HII, partial [Roseburia faecis]|nr:ribonuclease HII [Roseburia faecis]
MKDRLKDVKTLDDPFVQSMQQDERKGIQTALAQLKRRLERQAASYAAFKERFKYENQLWQDGKQYIAGIDEVGRGPLAGPVVTCAVILM